VWLHVLAGPDTLRHDPQRGFARLVESGKENLEWQLTLGMENVGQIFLVVEFFLLAVWNWQLDKTDFSLDSKCSTPKFNHGARK